ncbi:MAG: S41 family peptidase [Caldisericaceae bacterium]
MKRTDKIIAVVLVVFFSFSAGYIAGYKYPPFNLATLSNNNHTLLIQTADTIEKNFYKNVTEESLIKGMVDSLNDPYTVFMNPEETNALNEEISGTYAGIGVVIQENATYKLPQILTVFQPSPAFSAGLKKGDIIRTADGKDLKGLNLDEVSLIIKGKIGTKVTLTILRGKETLTFQVERATINIPLINVKYLDNGNIGYLQMNMFSEGLSTAVSKALDGFKAKNVKGIILDLRDNPGGLLSEAQGVAGDFMNSNILLWTKDRNGVEKPLDFTGKKLNLPVVILVNGGTASASEIFTGAMKYYGEATVVGEKTFGKGVIQQVFNLPGNYTVKVTIEEYLLPDKTSINGKGIEPDVVVANNPDNVDVDAQLDKAVEIIKGKIK